MDKLSLGFVLLVLLNSVQAQEIEGDEVNHLELASLMLKDGHLDRAALALSQVDLSQEGMDIQRFYVLSGLLAVRQNDNNAAIQAFQEAKNQGPVDSVIDVYLAQAAFAVEDHRLVISALNSAGPAVERIPSVYHMRAQSHWLLKEYEVALAIMDQAAKVFPETPGFMRRKIFYLIEMGMNHAAAALGQTYLTDFQAEASDYVAIGNALRVSGELTMALQFLELARLKFPQNADVAKSLAAAYINNEAYLSAAKIVHDLALNDNS